MVDSILSPEDQLSPFDRAIALDSSMVAALVHPMEIALLHGRRDELRNYIRLNQAAGGSDRGMTVAEELVWGSADDIPETMARAFEGGVPLDLSIAAAVQNNPGNVPGDPLGV